MDEVIIKAMNQQYVVKCHIQDFSQFQMLLKQKLQSCAALKQGHFDAFFDVSRKLDDHELYTIFQICRESQTTILGFTTVKKAAGLQICRQKLHSGQKYFFDAPTLVIGNIPRDTYVSCYDSLFVLGEASGNIDLYDRSALVGASIFSRCFIRICDTSFQNVTNYAPSQVYYNEQTLICRELKEEIVWDNQLL
ncbi:hypothetical protein GSF08_05225 [Clostridiaceae bacterium DONG20-135]|uniref:Uncharacterized protein n=1 Tax=Copranaerobaculum intestinale TaxID=2692629 RepID=A0A6N8U664_9FIRM|nr:hypothetical protein [Copranaerobaculum intestinale]MXQ73330.1 hypothetical protein [Copranaerobaculum intestinale]